MICPTRSASYFVSGLTLESYARRGMMSVGRVWSGDAAGISGRVCASSVRSTSPAFTNSTLRTISLSMTCAARLSTDSGCRRSRPVGVLVLAPPFGRLRLDLLARRRICTRHGLFPRVYGIVDLRQDAGDIAHGAARNGGRMTAIVPHARGDFFDLRSVPPARTTVSRRPGGPRAARTPLAWRSNDAGQCRHNHRAVVTQRSCHVYFVM